MIHAIDSVLRQLLISQVPNITSEDQIRFQPPDQEWRTVVAGLGARNALNVYLVEMRENRKLRSNEHTREIENGIAIDTPAPRRVDCHYLITAWSPAAPNLHVEATLDEHQLLYDVTAVLMKHDALAPRQIYAPASLPNQFPALLADAELPMTILPADGFPKYAEFWGTMGNVHPWKPAVHVVVTLPVAQQAKVAGPLVTTSITEYRQSGRPETAEVWIRIGGTVLDTSDPAQPLKPIPGASVRLETETGNPATEGKTLKSTETDAEGRFAFGELVPGRYRLRAYVSARGEQMRSNLDVPSPTGEYDVRFP